MAAEPLVCPTCATPHPLEDRFCRDCGMPLVYSGSLGVDQPVTDAHARARKIKPQLTEGELVRVAGGRNQAEAELIQVLLQAALIDEPASGLDPPARVLAGLLIALAIVAIIAWVGTELLV